MRPFRFLLSVWTATSLMVLGAANGHAQGQTELSSSRVDVGLGLRFMPVGWFDLQDGAHRSGFRAYPALGFAPFVDYRLHRYVSLGFSPEVTLNVIPNRSDYVVGEMLLGNARVQVRYPNRSRFEPYAILTGGYSVIWRSGDDAASGPVAGGALGLRARVAGTHAIFAELTYQKGFQTLDGGAYGPSYLIIGAGWQVGI